MARVGSQVSASTLVVLALVGCAGGSTHGASSSPPVTATTPAPTVPASSPGQGVAVALKATAHISFQSAGFSQAYDLASAPDQSNSLTVSDGTAVLSLGSIATQTLNVTVFGGAASGASLSGHDQVVAAFMDETAHQGGIATQGQGVCTLMLTQFATTGLSGSLDCENVAQLMGSSPPVSFRATITAVPA